MRGRGWYYRVSDGWDTNRFTQAGGERVGLLRSSTYLNFRIFQGPENFTVFQTLYDYASYYPCENYTNLDATNRQPREKGTSTYQLDFSLGLLSGRKLATSQTAIQKVRLLPSQKKRALS